jgi:hypothetical protein
MLPVTAESSRVDAKAKLEAMTKLVEDIKLICEETDVVEVILFYTRQYHTLFFAELNLHMPPGSSLISCHTHIHISYKFALYRIDMI